jgi:hypothetical protein
MCQRRGNGFCYNLWVGEKRKGGNSRARKAIETSARRGRKKDKMAKASDVADTVIK